MNEGRHIVTYHYRVVRLNGQDKPFVMSLNNYRTFTKHFVSAGLVKPELDMFGGATVSIIKNDRTGKYHIGISICNDSDRYDKRFGKKESIKRAEKALRKGDKFSEIGKATQSIAKVADILDVISSDLPLRYLYNNDKLSNEPAQVSPIDTVYSGDMVEQL